MKKNKLTAATAAIARRFFLTAVFAVALGAVCRAQTATAKSSGAQKNDASASAAVKSSPAYAEILLEKTELEAQLEDLAGDFTDDFPKVKELRYQVDLLQKALDKILALPPPDAPKLSLAFGRLAVRKAELETNLWTLRQQYKDDYPDVRRLRRKVAVFERALREILPAY